MHCKQLRNPRDTGPSAQFGIAYHKMLEVFYNPKHPGHDDPAGVGKAILQDDSFSKGTYKRDKLDALLLFHIEPNLTDAKACSNLDFTLNTLYARTDLQT
jgi:hypothetical protein